MVAPRPASERYDPDRAGALLLSLAIGLKNQRALNESDTVACITAVGDGNAEVKRTLFGAP